nr:PREDICTED: uncharacterized protein LOC109038928 [Bemisia tabaci]
MLSADLNFIIMQAVLLLSVLVSRSNSVEKINHSLFFRASNYNSYQNDPPRQFSRRNEPSTQSTTVGTIDPMEQTVEQILLWLQGKYLSSHRKTRGENQQAVAGAQEPSRVYLPSYPMSQKPRPFKPALEDPGYALNPDPSGTSPPAPTEGVLREGANNGIDAPKPPQAEGATSVAPPNDREPLEPDNGAAGQSPPNPDEQAGTEGAPGVNEFGVDQINPNDVSPVAESPDNSLSANSSAVTADSELNHPPHIHELVVQCAKDQMTISLEFNKVFDGVIYSKGFYSSPECRYVEPNSGKTKFAFSVMLNSCGTQFIDGIMEGKQAYLENVLVLQGEPGIQEVWDTIRAVRCLWEGNLNKALSVALTVGTPNAELVAFSGDTATAKLDIQMGKGPFAPAATGLVKIGELMTLVVTVDGDPGFNVLVRECIARDENPAQSGNMVQLTDSQGCVVKTKLLGRFQTTTNPETNSVIAYAYFNAFKFPDVMDLIIECNVDLCKAACQPCPNPNQSVDPGKRRRREVNNTSFATSSEPVTVAKRLRIYTPDEIEPAASSVVINVGSAADSVCISTINFIISTVVLVSLSIGSSIISATLYLRNHRKSRSAYVVK